MMKFIFVVLLVLSLSAVHVMGQIAPDPQIMAEINKTKAVDNHTHVPKVVGPGEKDDDFDALPCDPLQPTDPPLMARPENPKFMDAWRKLYGYKYNDRDPAHVRELLATKQRIAQQQGDKYPAWVLDQLGIEYMLSNRVAMGRGLEPPRFLWVPFDDALMTPLDNSSVADNPDRRFFYQREAALAQRYTKESGLASLPSTLDDYINKVLVPTLERQKKAGAVAIKFEAAYLRSLYFPESQPDEAQQIYSRYFRGGTPSKSEYLKLQDLLFRTTALHAGKLGLAVHIHTGAGCGGYFDVAGSNPSLLDSILNDESLRKTNFVLIHGGAGPYTKVTSFLLGKPNVYTDFSEQDALISTRALSAVIRDWLEWYPEKVLFGTDLAPGTPEIGWEEIGYSNATTGREALAVALTGMMADGEITRNRAIELARMVMRENALKLYGLK
ncbi:MAG: amidohydrolase family protein [Acidobacteriota bacterium]